MQRFGLDRSRINIRKKFSLLRKYIEKVLMFELTRRRLLRSGLTLSVGSAVAVRAAQAAEFLGLSAEVSDSKVAPRERLLMDFDWKFF